MITAALLSSQRPWPQLEQRFPASIQPELEMLRFFLPASIQPELEMLRFFPGIVRAAEASSGNAGMRSSEMLSLPSAQARKFCPTIQTHDSYLHTHTHTLANKPRPQNVSLLVGDIPEASGVVHRSTSLLSCQLATLKALEGELSRLPKPQARLNRSCVSAFLG